MMNHFRSTIDIKTTLERAFKALTQEISFWWGHQNELVSGKGDVFRVSWGEPWYEFEVTEFKPFYSIKWECIDANQIINGLEGVQKEWVGSQVHWNITKLDTRKCRITCTHVGLTPDLICFKVCSTTWDKYIHLELKKYLESGM